MFRVASDPIRTNPVSTGPAASFLGNKDGVRHHFGDADHFNAIDMVFYFKIPDLLSCGFGHLERPWPTVVIQKFSMVEEKIFLDKARLHRAELK